MDEWGDVDRLMTDLTADQGRRLSDEERAVGHQPWFTRGGIYSLEYPDWGRRPVLVLTREAAIPGLDLEDGLSVRCAVSQDNLGEAWKAMLTEHLTTLGPGRMREICGALSIAVGCDD